MKYADWDKYNQEILKEDAIDLYTPALAGANMRSRKISESGLFRLARRTCSLYSIEIKASGSWGRILIFDEKELWKFFQPSTFTGSFVLEGCCYDGLYVHSKSGPGTDALLTINWRELDGQLI